MKGKEWMFESDVEKEGVLWLTSFFSGLYIEFGSMHGFVSSYTSRRERERERGEGIKCNESCSLLRLWAYVWKSVTMSVNNIS